MSQVTEQITKPLITDDSTGGEAVMSPKLVLAWGLGDAVPDDVKLAWGARAIYSITTREVRVKNGRRLRHSQSETIATIDLLYDRQGTAGTGTDDERKALAAWINNKGLPALKRWCERHYITPDCEEKFELLDGSSYALVASPRASYGYLYIAAWVVPPGGLGDASEGK